MFVGVIHYLFRSTALSCRSSQRRPVFFFFNLKTAYEMRISDWSSDVCSSDLVGYLLFAEVPDGWTWAGAAVIAGAAIYIAQREAQVARQRPTLEVAAETVKERS